MGALPKTNCVTVLAGDRSTGKTWWLKQALKETLNKRNVKILLVSNFDNNTWKYLENDEEAPITPIPIIKKEDIPYWSNGTMHQEHKIMRTADRDVMETLRIIESYASNMTIAIEEAGKYFIDGHLPAYMNDLIMDSKQKNVDSVLVFHYLGEVPPKIAKKLDYLAIKKTKDVFEDIKKRFPAPELKEIMQILKNSSDKYLSATIYVGPG